LDDYGIFQSKHESTGRPEGRVHMPNFGLSRSVHLIQREDLWKGKAIDEGEKG